MTTGSTISVTATVAEPKGFVSTEFGIYNATEKLNDETVASGASSATATYKVQQAIEVKCDFIYTYTYTITTDANGTVIITKDGKPIQTIGKGETNKEVKVTGPKDSPVEISAESVDIPEQKYLFDKWISGAPVDTVFDNIIADLNTKPLADRKIVHTKLNNDRTLTAQFLKARKLTITKATENVAGVTKQAKGILTVQYDREPPLNIENGSKEIFVPENTELTINAVQDSSDGYIPYTWIDENGVEVTDRYKKQYKKTIPSGNSNLSYTVSFVQRYTYTDNGAYQGLSIVHPKDASGNIIPDTEAAELIIPKTVNDKEVTVIAQMNEAGRKGVFEGWKNLQKITFPDTLRQIKNNAFKSLTKLSELNFPEACNAIGPFAFDGCTNLKKITFNNANISQVLPQAFTNCPAISELMFNGEGTFNTAGRSVTQLFQQNSGTLKKVTFGSGITNFATNTGYFRNCTALETVDLGEHNKTWNNGSAAAPNCFLPDNIFNGCTSLKKVKNISADIKVLGVNAFADCKALESISLPKSLNQIQATAFKNCTALTEINLQNATNIIINSFSGCTGIKKFIINRPQANIPAGSLAQMNALKEIIVNNTERDADDRPAVKKLTVNLSLACQTDSIRQNITSIVIGKDIDIPAQFAPALTALKNFSNAAFSVPNEEWKSALKNTGIDETRITVR